MTRSFPRILAAGLCLALALPSSAYGLRREQTQNSPRALSGLEQALRDPKAALKQVGRFLFPQKKPSAGLEEQIQLLDSVTRNDWYHFHLFVEQMQAQGASWDDPVVIARVITDADYTLSWPATGDQIDDEIARQLGWIATHRGEVNVISGSAYAGEDSRTGELLGHDVLTGVKLRSSIDERVIERIISSMRDQGGRDPTRIKAFGRAGGIRVTFDNWSKKITTDEKTFTWAERVQVSLTFAYAFMDQVAEELDSQPVLQHARAELDAVSSGASLPMQQPAAIDALQRIAQAVDAVQDAHNLRRVERFTGLEVDPISIFFAMKPNQISTLKMFERVLRGKHGLLTGSLAKLSIFAGVGPYYGYASRHRKVDLLSEIFSDPDVPSGVTLLMGDGEQDDLDMMRAVRWNLTFREADRFAPTGLPQQLMIPLFVHRLAEEKAKPGDPVVIPPVGVRQVDATRKFLATSVEAAQSGTRLRDYKFMRGGLFSPEEFAQAMGMTLDELTGFARQSGSSSWFEAFDARRQARKGDLGGLEERPPQPRGWNTNRRGFLRSTLAAVAGVAVLSPSWLGDGEPERMNFLLPNEVPDPWRGLFSEQNGRAALPNLEENYLLLRMNGERSDSSEMYAFDLQGQELGQTELSHGWAFQKVIDPRTGEMLGYFHDALMGESESSLSAAVGSVLQDRYGDLRFDITFYPYDENRRPLPGVPPEDARPPALPYQPGDLRPIYRGVSRGADGLLSEVEPIGFVRLFSDQQGTLYDLGERPIAYLEPSLMIFDRSPEDVEQAQEVALADRTSQASSYFNQEPSQEIARNLEGRLNLFRPTTLTGKKAKLQLASRLTQIQVELGEIQVAVDPSQAEAVGEQLLLRGLQAMSQLEDPVSRQLLWNALANQHPWFAMVVQAVRELGWENDPEILQYVLAEFQLLWKVRLFNATIILPGDGQLDRKTFDLLLSTLNYNSVQTFDRAAGQFERAVKVTNNPTLDLLYIDRPGAVGSEFTPTSYTQAQMEGYYSRVSDYQHLLHHGIALERLGCDCELISVLPVETVKPTDENTRVLSHEWFLRVRSPDQPDTVTVHSTNLEFLKRFKGEAISPGIIRLTPIQLAEGLSDFPDQFGINLRDHPAADSLDAKTYLGARAQARQELELDPDASLEPAEFLGVGLGLANVPESQLRRPFTRALSASYVQEMVKRFDEVTELLGIEVDTGSLDGKELEARKAGVGAALGLSPGKFVRGLKKIRFLKDSPRVAHDMVTLVDGNFVRERRMVDAEGYYVAENQELVVVGGVGTPIHELGHHWDLHVTDQVRDWRGDLSDLFYEISWQRPRRGALWRLRKETDVDMRDFRDRTYAATTEREDIAVHQENYVMGADRFRREVRAAMRDGNFAPAAKYLFMKYLFFLDGDGISFEYSISPSGRSINFEGVLNAMRPYVTGARRDPEAVRLAGLIQQMQEVWMRQRESGSVVQLDAEPEVLALADLQQLNPDGSGVLVLTPEAFNRGGLEELIRRLPQPALDRLILYAAGGIAQRLKGERPELQVIEQADVEQLVLTLLSMPEADQVSVIGAIQAAQLAQTLSAQLPPSVAVKFMEFSAKLRAILEAIGIPQSTLNRIDTQKLQEFLTRLRAA